MKYTSFIIRSLQGAKDGAKLERNRWIASWPTPDFSARTCASALDSLALKSRVLPIIHFIKLASDGDASGNGMTAHAIIP